MTDKKSIASVEKIESRIFLIRGQKVMLDEDFAALYGVETRRLNEQVRRNSERFPEDFMFQLTAEELADLKSQSVTSNKPVGRGGRRSLPLRFHRIWRDHGGQRAEFFPRSRASVQVVRAFVQLWQMLASNAELWIKQLAIRLSCMSSAAKSLVIAQTGRAGKEIRHQIQSGFRCHPRIDDPAGNEEKTAHRFCAVGKKMMLTPLAAHQSSAGKNL